MKLKGFKRFLAALVSVGMLAAMIPSGLTVFAAENSSLDNGIVSWWKFVDLDNDGTPEFTDAITAENASLAGQHHDENSGLYSYNNVSYVHYAANIRDTFNVTHADTLDFYVAEGNKGVNRSYLDVGTSSTTGVDYSDGFTISFNVMYTDAAATDTLFAWQQNAGNNGGDYLVIRSDYVYYNLNGVSGMIEMNEAYNYYKRTNTWYNITLRIDPDTNSIVFTTSRSGETKAKTTTLSAANITSMLSGLSDLNYLYLGGSGLNPGYQLQHDLTGYMDGLMIWNRALDDDEIDSVQDGDTPSYIVDITNPDNPAYNTDTVTVTVAGSPAEGGEVVASGYLTKDFDIDNLTAGDYVDSETRGDFTLIVDDSAAPATVSEEENTVGGTTYTKVLTIDGNNAIEVTTEGPCTLTLIASGDTALITSESIGGTSVDTVNLTGSQASYDVAISEAGTYYIYTTGSIDVADVAVTYEVSGTTITVSKGSDVTISATPDTENYYVFNNWTVNGSEVSTSATDIITVDSNTNFIANFDLELDQVTVTVAPSPAAGGNVQISYTETEGSAPEADAYKISEDSTTTTLTGAAPNNTPASDAHRFTNPFYNGGYSSITFSVTANTTDQNDYNTLVEFLSEGSGFYSLTSSGSTHKNDWAGSYWDDLSGNASAGQHTYTVVINGTGETVYVDGVQAYTHADANLLSYVLGRQYMAVGSYNTYDGTTWAWNSATGTVSKIVAYNTALTASQIQEAIAGGSSSSHVVTDPSSATVDIGTTVTLSATANQDYTFLYWSNDGGVTKRETATYSYPANEDADWIAYFRYSGDITITVNAVPRDGGVVEANGTHTESVTNTTTTTEIPADAHFISENTTTYTLTGAGQNGAAASDAVRFANPFYNGNYSSITFTVDANLSSVSQWSTLVQFTTGATGFFSVASNGSVHLNEWDGTNFFDDNDGTAVAGAHTYMVTVTSSAITVYQDGVQVNTYTGSKVERVLPYILASPYMAVGDYTTHDSDWNWGSANGTISNISAYDTALTPADFEEVETGSSDTTTEVVPQHSFSSITVDSASSVTLTAHESEGYTFQYWTQDGGTTKIYDAVYTYEANANADWVAHYTIGNNEITPHLYDYLISYFNFNGAFDDLIQTEHTDANYDALNGMGTSFGATAVTTSPSGNGTSYIELASDVLTNEIDNAFDLGFTAVTEVTLSSYNADSSIFYFADASNNNVIRVTEDLKLIVTIDGVTKTVECDETLATGEAGNIMVTVNPDDDVIELYFNGVLVSSLSDEDFSAGAIEGLLDSIPTMTQKYVGYTPTDASVNDVAGSFDELRLYNRYFDEYDAQEVYYEDLVSVQYMDIAGETKIDLKLLKKNSLSYFPESYPIEVGYNFVGWFREDTAESYSDLGAVNITVYNRVNEDITYLCVYEIYNNYTVTITGDNAEYVHFYNDEEHGLQKDYYTARDQVGMWANSTNGDGQVFAYWTKNGKIASYERAYFFTIIESSAIQAVYVDAGEVPEATPIINLVLTANRNGTSDNISFIAERKVPEGYTVVQSGVIILKAPESVPTTENFVIGGTGVIRRGTTATALYGLYEFNGTVTPGTLYYARAYLTYSDGNTQTTIYTDIGSAVALTTN